MSYALKLQVVGIFKRNFFICTLEVTEGNVRVKLRIVETAGFGDQLDKEKR